MRLHPVERLILWISAVALILNLLLMWVKGVTATVEHFAIALIPAAVFIAIGQVLRRFDATQRLSHVFHSLAMTLIAVPLATNLIFLALPLRAPIDPWLIQFDAMFGWSWIGVFNWMAQYELLNAIVRTIYLLTVPASTVCLLFLCLADDFRRLLITQFALILSLYLTIFAWILFPSAGVSAFLALDPAVVAIVKPVGDSGHGADIVRMMRDGITDLAMIDVRGMIGFPSYHTAMGFLTLAAVYPYRLVRWFFLIQAPFLLLGILTHGSHSLLDVAGGLVIAACSWAVAQRLVDRFKVPATYAEISNAGALQPA